MHPIKAAIAAGLSRKISVFFFGCAFACTAVSQTVPFAIGEWPPYTGQGLPGNGLACEIASAACRQAGLVPRYEFFPWKRAEAFVESGDFFASFPYRSTGERLSKFLFSAPLFRSSSAILLYADNPLTGKTGTDGPASLAGVRVLVTTGSDALRAPLAAAGALVGETASMSSGLLMLETARTDALVDDRRVLLYHLARSYDPERRRKFILADYSPGETAEYRLMVSAKYRNASALLERFNAGLSGIVATGEYRAILEKYGR